MVRVDAAQLRTCSSDGTFGFIMNTGPRTSDQRCLVTLLKHHSEEFATKPRNIKNIITIPPPHTTSHLFWLLWLLNHDDVNWKEMFLVSKSRPLIIIALHSISKTV